ncbi:MAG TPA: D-alanyl-D-alanine carboxypeptidase/D-alanyl-D-alanine-endopeptidase [Mycobacteriales bacterium]|nr:D-alanyl-D-alanine carboxypeptidase/D-alanyl-D-alanine-endopeptidase [Mycobacteriales bacterium]
MLRTHYAVAILAVFIVAILGTGITVVVLHYDAVRADNFRCSEPCFAKPSPVLRPQLGSPSATTPTQTGLEQALAAYVTRPELGEVSASVIDHNTGKVLWQRQGEAAMVPASVTKLSTAVAVLARRGPEYRIPTTVVAGDEPGEVVLVAGGDVTLAAGKGYYPGAGSLVDLAAQVRKAHPQPITKLVIDTSLYSGQNTADGWDGDVVTGGYGIPAVPLAIDGGRAAPRGDQRVNTPVEVAGKRFASLLGGGSNMRVDVADHAPIHAQPLGMVQSPSVARLVEIMLAESDNVIADSLARQVAIERHQPASFAGAAAAVLNTLTGVGVNVSGAQLSDGSGLSRNDRLSADLLAQLIGAAGRRPELRAVLSGLPVAGFSGTLDGRFADPTESAAVSDVRAKTGSLSQVSSLAGTLATADGSVLDFAVIANGFPSNGGDTAEQGIDRIAGALARCGCR